MVSLPVHFFLFYLLQITISGWNVCATVPAKENVRDYGNVLRQLEECPVGDSTMYRMNIAGTGVCAPPGSQWETMSTNQVESLTFFLENFDVENLMSITVKTDDEEIGSCWLQSEERDKWYSNTTTGGDVTVEYYYPTTLQVSGSCSDIDGSYQYLTTSTGTGRPIYRNGEGVYLVYDPDCRNDGIDESDPRWIFRHYDDNELDLNADKDLNNDGYNCFGLSIMQSASSSILGSHMWASFCPGSSSLQADSITIIDASREIPAYTIGNGLDCVYGYAPIEDAVTCAKAAQFLDGTWRKVLQEGEDDRPHGCYERNIPMKLYFNPHENPTSADGSSNAVCKLIHAWQPPSHWCSCLAMTRADGHHMPPYCSPSPISGKQICYVSRQACTHAKSSQQSETYDYVLCVPDSNPGPHCVTSHTNEEAYDFELITYYTACDGTQYTGYVAADANGGWLCACDHGCLSNQDGTFDRCQTSEDPDYETVSYNECVCPSIEPGWITCASVDSDSFNQNNAVELMNCPNGNGILWRMIDCDSGTCAETGDGLSSLTCAEDEIQSCCLQSIGSGTEWYARSNSDSTEFIIQCTHPTHIIVSSIVVQCTWYGRKSSQK